MNDKRMRMSMIARAEWRENGVEVEVGVGVEGMESMDGQILGTKDRRRVETKGG